MAMDQGVGDMAIVDPRATAFREPQDLIRRAQQMLAVDDGEFDRLNTIIGVDETLPGLSVTPASSFPAQF
jgi:hypothetical protein